MESQEQEGKMKSSESKRVTVESLGWLTESTIMPKKHRAISGVGPTSILELKAQLYQSQEDVKKEKELAGPDSQFLRPKNKTNIVPQPPNHFSSKNPGVDARALKDKLELKAEKDGTKSYEALERKALLYDKLVRGELSDEEDQEKYCVDFFRKNIQQGDAELATEPPSTSEQDADDVLDLFNTKLVGPGRRAAEVVDNDEHKRFVREVHEEASQAREKASDLKLRRQEQVAARREKLRQAYLKKQLEKLKASAKPGETQTV